ncbi:hypothetical protein BSL82_04990 [Tardibacter chloracetimidivorans]|uniref:DUF1508 domain-containing protein n=1 Tax=Tardibacter chloracetimidivorans TaxID=1921510 RepID=A0A1L3ZT28_9SPHN|nr:hypothetical protein [Tardibacter chloracetimidivorans]API58750.1 hypothetical protein BSL82_04990 [Tardibacter chloracetimidivorans]
MTMDVRRLITIRRDLWGHRFRLTVEPASVLHPSRSFHEIADAQTAAAELSDATGWPWTDLSGEGDDA